MARNCSTSSDRSMALSSLAPPQTTSQSPLHHTTTPAKCKPHPTTPSPTTGPTPPALPAGSTAASSPPAGPEPAPSATPASLPPTALATVPPRATPTPAPPRSQSGGKSGRGCPGMPGCRRWTGVGAGGGAGGRRSARAGVGVRGAGRCIRGGVGGGWVPSWLGFPGGGGRGRKKTWSGKRGTVARAGSRVSGMMGGVMWRWGARAVEPVQAALLQEHPRHRVLLAGHGELLGWWHRLGSAS